MTPEQWERVGQIFDAAAALQPDERPSFLDQACGQDETLRHEVESLLSLEGEDKGFPQCSCARRCCQVAYKRGGTIFSGPALEKL
jgi:hypothetical protein